MSGPSVAVESIPIFALLIHRPLLYLGTRQWFNQCHSYLESIWVDVRISEMVDWPRSLCSVIRSNWGEKSFQTHWVCFASCFSLVKSQTDATNSCTFPTTTTSSSRSYNTTALLPHHVPAFPAYLDNSTVLCSTCHHMPLLIGPTLCLSG